jgi:PAS domain S-box-containing protein
MRTSKKKEPRQVGADKSSSKKGRLEPLKPLIKAAETDALQMRAEQKDGSEITTLGKKSSEDIARLVHELEVHQIELEKQNDEFRRIQKDLEESRRRYHELFDLAPVGYFTFDKNGVILDVNQTGCQQLDAEKIYLIKKPFHLFVSPESQDNFHLHNRQVFQSNESQNCEVTLIGRDGEKIDVLLKSMRAVNEKDEFTFIHTTVIDITEQKTAEQELRKNEEMFRSVFESGIIGVAMCSPDKKWLYANDRLCEILGYSRDELYQTTWDKLTHPDDIEADVEQFNRLLAG